MQVIRDLVLPLARTVRVALRDAGGFALAESVGAREPNPRFDNSGVDGYAIGSIHDSEGGVRLRIQGIVAAGESSQVQIEPGSAVRIFTGAPTPANTFGIAMQEDVEVDGDSIILRSQVRIGEFIRRRGAEFDEGAELCRVGTVVDSGIAALLAFAGYVEPLVYQAPRVSVLTTGDELVEPTEVPIGGQIRDTNSVMLAMQVRQSTGRLPSTTRVIDDRESLKFALIQATAESDLVILSGGASVGDRDFVAGLVAEIGTVFFHGVAIRPGKPILFGKIGECFVFGLPGNPASAFVCFEIFVREAIRRLSGWGEPELLWTEQTVGFDHPNCRREDFVRIRVEGSQVVESGHQGSFGIGSLGRAHGIARFPASHDVSSGTVCPVLWLK